MKTKANFDPVLTTAGEIIYLELKSKSIIPSEVKLNFINGKGRGKTTEFYKELHEYVKDLPVKNSDIFPTFECALRSECGQQACFIMNTVHQHNGLPSSKKQLFVLLHKFNELIKLPEMAAIYNEFTKILIKHYA